MYCKRTKLLCTSLTLTILLSALFPLIQISAAQDTPRIFVDPAENIYYTDTTSVGFEFTVSIMAADWSEPGVFSYQFKLTFDNSMLEAVAAEIPDGHYLTPEDPSKIFVVDAGTINNELGFASFGVTLLAPETGKTGSGTIATVTLKITGEPPAVGKLSCALALDDVILVDPEASPISPAAYEVIHGSFEFSAPPPPIYLKVEPSTVTAALIGDEVNIRITIYDVEAELKIIGVQFKLFFNSSILKVKEVTEGDFFQAFGSTFFQAYAEHGYVVGFVILLPAEGISFPVPEGYGTVVKIKFETISLPEVLTEFPLELDDDFTFTIDQQANVVPPRRLEDAVLLVPTRLEDLNEDGKVDIQDITIFAVAFGSYPGHSRWNPKADVDKNGKVNILDGVLIAKSYGK